MVSLVIGRVDIGQIFGILILVISVLSWIVNLVQGNTPDGRPRPQKPKPKPQGGPSEIEALLQELSNKPKAPPSKPQQEKSQSTATRPPVERARPKQPAGRQKAMNQTAPPAARSSLRVGDAKLPAADLGAGVRSHQLGNRVEAAVEREINTAVKKDLGSQSLAVPSLPERPVHPLVKSLRDPNNIRQAIVLNEIFQRPKSLRH
jgi:hypothetical protein